VKKKEKSFDDRPVRGGSALVKQQNSLVEPPPYGEEKEKRVLDELTERRRGRVADGRRKIKKEKWDRVDLLRVRWKEKKVVCGLKGKRESPAAPELESQYAKGRRAPAPLSPARAKKKGKGLADPTTFPREKTGRESNFYRLRKKNRVKEDHGFRSLKKEEKIEI